MSRIHRTVLLAAGIALGGATAAFAGVSGLVLEQLQQSSASSAPAPSYSSGASSSPSYSYSAPSAAPSYSPPPAQRSDPRPRSAQSTRSQPSATPRQQAPSVNLNQGSRSSQAPRGGGTRNETAPTYNPPGNESGVLGGALSRNFRDRTPGNGGGNGNGNGNGGGGGGHGGHHHHYPPYVVYTLPPYYRDYWWDGYPYYTFGGGWYRPFGGNGYIAVDAPYGLFVSSLPGYSTSFWYGNTRYYYYDDTYYTYDSGRRGYVVARSPYDDDEEYYEEGAQPDLDMYIYPSNGQSEQQQADDRYACHKWATREAGYDPIDGEYDRNKRADYTRAMTACLNGRGYSVR